MTSNQHPSSCYTRDYNPSLKSKIGYVWSRCHGDAGDRWGRLLPCHLARDRVTASVNLSVNHLSSPPACTKCPYKDWQTDAEECSSGRSSRSILNQQIRTDCTGGNFSAFTSCCDFLCCTQRPLLQISAFLCFAWFSYGISRSRRRRSSERSRSWRTCEGGPTSSDWWTQSKTQW